MTQNKVTFVVHKEKGVLFDARDEFVNRNQTLTSATIPVLDDGPILETPQIFVQLFQRKLTEKVSKLKNLFKGFLELIEDKDVVS